ncbi:MAG: HAD family hydrolase [Parachlamydiaceae bacterium]
MKKALLIDLDGTLIDTHPALYDVYNKFLAQYGKKGTREEFESLIGPSIEEIVAVLKKKHQLSPTVEELANYYISIMMFQGFQGTALLPGAKETLDQLKNKGMKLALVTSGTKSLVNQCLEPLKLTNYFDLVVTSEEVKKSKPHPDLYITALKKLSLKPGEAFAIEDSPAGAESATQAGVDVIMITHGEDNPMPMNKSISCLKDWNEIGKWLLQK